MRRAPAVIVVLLASFPFLRGDSPPAKPTIEQLIEQLNDNRYPVRRAAEKAIEEMGPDALPALRKALAAKPNLDLARRIEKWIPLFELAALSNPKRITLDVKNRPVREVIEMIAKQSGYPITLTPDAGKENKQVDFKFERATFWEALDAVCSSAGLLAGREDGKKTIQLTFSDCYEPFVYRHGAFRLVGRYISNDYHHSRTRAYQLAKRPRKGRKELGPDEIQESKTESLMFIFLVEPEPRVPVVRLDDAIVSEAVDDQKRSLVSDSPEEDRIQIEQAFAPVGGPGLRVGMILKPPSKNAKKLERLKGTVGVHLEKERKRQILAEKFLEAQGKKVRIDQVTLTVDIAKKGEEQNYELQMSCFSAESALDEDDLSGEFELRDAKGELYHIQSQVRSNGGRRNRLHLNFVAPNAQTGPPTKLVYVTKVTVKYLLPFEFHDLPLP